MRILAEAELAPGPGFNLVSGANASGKTTVLEAIFLLSRGRSFRSARFEAVVRHGCGRYIVAGAVRGVHRAIPLGVERTRERLTLRIDGRAAEGRAELTALLPVQLIHPNSHTLLEDGPGVRRQYLDWGVFHVEPRFHGVWRRFQRALRQRNAALRTQSHTARAWDGELAAAGSALDALRRAYLAVLAPEVCRLTERLTGLEALELRYERGWRQGRELAEQLDHQWAQDRERGYTGVGPHRADLRVRLQGGDAADRVSRGQQKLLVTAMVLAQTQVVQARSGRRAVVLVDDLAAELDSEHRGRLLALLGEIGPQVFVTAIEPEALVLPPSARRFHVEHGRVREMV